MISDKVKENFWLKVNKQEPEDCWEWTASTWDGYGSFGIGNGRTTRAHRVSWMIEHGAIPSGLYVLHRCDNRLCVNPAHLFLGTHQDNQKDKIAKGRQYHPTKEKNPQYGKIGEQATCFGRTGAKHPLFGKHHTEATKLKMRESHVKRKLLK